MNGQVINVVPVLHGLLNDAGIKPGPIQCRVGDALDELNRLRRENAELRARAGARRSMTHNAYMDEGG